MWALEGREAGPAPALLAGTPSLLLAGLGAVLVSIPVPIVAATAAHAALLATALGWAAADAGWQPRAAQFITTAGLAAAAAATAMDARAGWLYLANTAWLAWLARRGRLAPLGVRAPGAGALIAGIAAGGVLGAHLWMTAVGLLGYEVRPATGAPYLAALAYDVGATVPSSEAFFRGALMGRLSRRLSFAAAATLAAIACVARYLADPLLPGAAEVRAGALLYVFPLALSSAWLFRWSGSLLPGAAAWLVFFAVYRRLVVD